MLSLVLFIALLMIPTALAVAIAFGILASLFIIARMLWPTIDRTDIPEVRSYPVLRPTIDRTDIPEVRSYPVLLVDGDGGLIGLHSACLVSTSFSKSSSSSSQSSRGRQDDEI